MKGFTQNKRKALLFGLSALFALGSVAAVTTATVNNGFSLTGITAAAESRVTYKTVSAVLSDAIGVRFYFNGLQEGDTATISCLTTTREGVAYKTDANGDYFEYNGITAKMLQDKITVTVKDADKNKLFTAEQNATDYLIKASKTDWLALKHANGTMNNVLVSDVLKYGAAAEIYTDHNANNAIKTYMADYSFDFNADEVAVEREGNAYYHGDTKVCALEGTVDNLLSWGSVRLDLTNAIRIAFTYTVDAENAADYKMVVKKGKEVVKTFTPQKGENEAFAPVYFSELCDGVYTATLQDAEGNPVGQEFTYSVMMYVNQHQNDENALADLVKSLWQAGKSAAIYKKGGAFNYIDDDLTKVVATDGTLSYTVEGKKSESTVGGQGTKECIGNSFGTHYTYVLNEKTYAPQKDEEGAVKIVSGIYYNDHFVSDYEMYTEGFNTDTEGVTYDQESNTYKVTAAPTKGTIVSIYNANVDVQADLKDLCVEAYKGTIGDVTISSGTVTKLTISGGNEDTETHTLTNNGTLKQLDITSGKISVNAALTAETVNVKGGDFTIKPSSISTTALSTQNFGITGGNLTINGFVHTNKFIVTGGNTVITVDGGNAVTRLNNDVYYYLLGGTMKFVKSGDRNNTAIDVGGANQNFFILGSALNITFENFINDAWNYKSGAHWAFANQANITSDSTAIYGEAGKLNSNKSGWSDWSINGYTPEPDKKLIIDDGYWKDLCGWSGKPWESGKYQTGTDIKFGAISHSY